MLCHKKAKQQFTLQIWRAATGRDFCKANYSIFFFPSVLALSCFAEWVLNHNSEQKELQFCPTCQTQLTAKRLIPKLPNNAVAAVGLKPDVYKNFESYSTSSHFFSTMPWSSLRRTVKLKRCEEMTKKKKQQQWENFLTCLELGEREKRMHGGIWVIEEREKERETEVLGTKAVLYHLNDFWSESFKTSPEG